MKVMRSTEWEPIAWADNVPGIEGPAYLFCHKKYFDVVALKVAKWIDVTADVVYFYNAEKKEVSDRGRANGYEETTLPRLSIRVG